MIDHVTVHIHSTALHHKDLGIVLRSLGLVEIDAAEEIAQGWDVRWFHATEKHGDRYYNILKPELHLVAADDWPQTPEPALSHFCVVGVGDEMFKSLCAETFIYREHYTPGSKRVWVNYHGLRIEVRA